MTTEVPEVSVLMTVYNVSSYLSQAIDSILNQSLTNFQFIIVDDGSNDGSDAILRKYAQKDERIKVLSQENQGLYPALNRGLELCDGQYIARMDADDIAISNRLEIQAKYLSEHHNIALISGSIQAINTEGMNIGYWVWPTSPDDIRNLMLTTMCIFHPAVMVRKDALLEMGGYPINADSGQDNVLWVDMIIKGLKIGNLPDVVLKWRAGRSGSITSTKTKKQKLEVLQCRNRLVSYARSPGGWLTPQIENVIQKAFPSGGSPLDNKPFYPESIDLIDPIGTQAISGNLESCMRAWLVGKDEAAETMLVKELESNGHHFLGSLVGKLHTLEIIDFFTNTYYSKPTIVHQVPANPEVTIILLWSDYQNDIDERIESIKQSTIPVCEIILLVPYSAKRDIAFKSFNKSDNLTIRYSDGDLRSDLLLARKHAKGTVIGYLPPMHRYNQKFLEMGIKILLDGKTGIVFANRMDLYPEILIHGKQLQDIPRPLPVDRLSVIGQEGRNPLGYLQDERIYLGGFLHINDGNMECKLPLDKCVPDFDWIIAMDWAYRMPLKVLPICNTRIRRDFHFENRLWKAFLRATIQHNLESAFGLLEEYTNKTKHCNLGKELESLIANGYPIHSRNRKSVFNTYILNVSSPWRYPVFQEICKWYLRNNLVTAKSIGGYTACVHVLTAWSASLYERIKSRLLQSNSNE